MRRFLIVVLAAISLVVPAACDAEARTTITIAGRKIVIIGGTWQSVSSTEKDTRISVDGHTIVISQGKLNIDGVSADLPEFVEMELRITNETVSVELNGEAFDPN